MLSVELLQAPIFSLRFSTFADGCAELGVEVFWFCLFRNIGISGFDGIQHALVRWLLVVFLTLGAVVAFLDEHQRLATNEESYARMEAFLVSAIPKNTIYTSEFVPPAQISRESFLFFAAIGIALANLSRPFGVDIITSVERISGSLSCSPLFWRWDCN